MQESTDHFEILNQKKANFDAIYSQHDPREYYRVLYGLDYIIPDLAKDVFRAAIEAYRGPDRAPVKVLDVGCSYGINSALIRFPLDMQRLARRYAHPHMHTLNAASVMGLDWHYFRSWPNPPDVRFIGLDSSHAAAAYATRVGLLETCLTTDLERNALPAEEAGQIADLDLIVSTGCVGYVTERTFRALLAAQKNGRRRPWVVNFVLRMFSYDAIAEELGRFGLVTEKFPGVTFVQRRFHSRDEFRSTLEALERRSISPANKEADGLLHAELYVSRPPEDVRDLPLGHILSVTSGANRHYGRRFRYISQRDVKLMH